MQMYTENEPPRRGIVSLRSNPPPPKSSAGTIVHAVVSLVIAAFVIAGIVGYVAAHSQQQVQITTCTISDQCYQTTVPVQSQAP